MGVAGSFRTQHVLNSSTTIYCNKQKLGEILNSLVKVGGHVPTRGGWSPSRPKSLGGSTKPTESLVVIRSGPVHGNEGAYLAKHMRKRAAGSRDQHITLNLCDSDRSALRTQLSSGLAAGDGIFSQPKPQTPKPQKPTL